MQQTSEIYIICNNKSPRLSYIANFIAHKLGLPVEVKTAVTNINEHTDYTLFNGQCVINYNKTPVNGAFNIYDSGFLFEKGVRQFIPDIKKEAQNILLFTTHDNFSLNFDLFSAIFYLISRYEEYLPFIPDKYGRFSAQQSFAYRNNFLEVPVVDQWLEMFKKLLISRWSFLKFKSSQFRFVSTIDVDYPWAYKYRSIVRNISTVAKDAIFFNSGVVNKIRMLSGIEKDIYDNYDYIKAIDDRYHISSIFFFLLGNYGYPDVNYSLNSRHFKVLISDLRKNKTIGIHPSYKSNSKIEYLKKEFEVFKSLSGEGPSYSRQHFLAIKLPETYQQLISLGIQIDYSMGYATNIGFRCGTSLPFKFYNLIEESESSLIIHPFSIMDVTLNQYFNLNSLDAVIRIKDLIGRVKKVNGVFTSIWHNSSLSDKGEWKGWRVVFEKMYEEACHNK